MTKTIIIDGVETNYTISDNGEVYNKITKKFLQGTIKRNEYRSVQLTIGDKLKTIMVHRLVALMFLDNPNNLPYVHHKDGDKLNNNLNNLEWVTEQENSLHKFENQLNIRKDIAENNNWAPIRNFESKYMINKNGQVKNIQTNKNLSGTIRNGYLRYNLSGKLYSAHRLVWETFKGEIPERYVIDHIDGDKQNNSIDNLRCITQSENAINAQNNGHKGQHKVAQYDLNNNNLIKEYPSFTAAAKEFGVSYAAISSAAKRGGTSCGYKWKEL